MTILKDALPSIEVTVSSRYSPLLADGLMRGELDLAFMRPEPQRPGLDYKLVTREPLLVVLPSDHRLAAQTTIRVEDLAQEPFLGMSDTAPALQVVIDDYLKRVGVALRPAHVIDNLGMAISLIASTRGVTLLPAYALNFLPWSVVSRPLAGDVPTIDLVMGYDRANNSPTLKLFLSRSDELVSRVARRMRNPASAPG